MRPEQEREAAENSEFSCVPSGGWVPPTSSNEEGRAGVPLATKVQGQIQKANAHQLVQRRSSDVHECGELTIETGNTHLDEKYAKDQGELTAGDYVVISVS